MDEQPIDDSARDATQQRRTLRFWAACDVLHAAALALAVATLVPWKTPWVNAAFLAYAAAKVVGAVGMWQTKRWGWRVSAWSALAALVACSLLTAGLVMSWAYLKGVFGDFGRGTSIAALLFASVALQVLGLFPALKLRALLRAEVRFGSGPGWRRALWGLAVAPFVLGAFVWLGWRTDPLAPVSDAARQAAVAYTRAALMNEPRPSLDAAKGVPVGRDRLFVTLWDRGAVVARAGGVGADLAAAVEDATTGLLGDDDLHGRKTERGQLKFDRAVDVNSVPFDFGPLVALSVDHGLDGLRRIDGDASRTRLADDLVRSQRFGAAPLVPGIRELRFGLDAKRELVRLGMPGARLERLRYESWVEFDGKALHVERGNTPAPTGPKAWKDAAISAGDFVLRQIRKDGRFHYQYFPIKDRHTKSGEYSMPRHAGTVYALAELYSRTKEARYKKGVERAADWLVKNLPGRCGDLDATCVYKSKATVANLGSSALTMVGMLFYQRATGDDRYAGAVRRIGDFVLAMQRESGDFDHFYDLKKKVRHPRRSMFYSEEAAFALVMAAKVLGDPKYKDAAERALDFLTGPKYSGYMVAHFIYGADHWTCIATEEAWPLLKKPEYLDFCRGYAAFIRRIQYQPGEYAAADFLGHYGFGGFMVPQAPAAAGFSEAIVSTVQLSRHHGVDDPALTRQMHLALDALTRDQMRLDNAWLMKRPRKALGGIRRSLVESEVRIDFTQHAMGALIRGAEI